MEGKILVVDNTSLWVKKQWVQSYSYTCFKYRYILVYVPSKGSLPNTHGSKYCGISFWEKEELYCEVDRQGGRRQGSQICLLDSELELGSWLASHELVHISYSCCWKPYYPHWRTSYFIKGSGGNISIL